MAVANFEELKLVSENCVEGMKRKGCFNSTRKLLEKLYPDRAHFIYELIQNAEDAGAAKVEFYLKDSELVLIHDGTKLFDLSHVESITNIGDSTKKEQGGNIGKFGIGFKSVFAYTDNPEIQSGDWHFKIKDMMIPEIVASANDWDGHYCAEKTHFRFPFDNPKKPREKAYSEIVEGMNSLEVETLLFLSNIKEIEFWTNDSKLKLEKKNDEQIDDERIVVLRKSFGDGQQYDVRYYLFTKTIKDFEVEECDDEAYDDGEEKEVSKVRKDVVVGVSYRLIERNKKVCDIAVRVGNQYEIVAKESRNVFVFFPAEKENPTLRFCIHAPFATTASRDGIRNTDDNTRLMAEVVKLQCESIEHLKKQDLLTTEFLGILTNSKDQMYNGFNAALVNLFRTCDLTPTKYGEYSPATQLYKGTPELSSLLNDEDLSRLVGNDNAKWVKNAAQKNSNSDRFLQDLGMTEFEMKDFVAILVDRQKVDRVNKALKDKDVAWLVSLYTQLNAFLNKLSSQYSWYRNDEYETFRSGLRDAPIIKLSGGGFACAVDQVYVCAHDEVGDAEQGERFVDPAVYSDSVPAKEFFAKLGIAELSESARVKKYIEKFDANNPPLDEVHAKWFDRLLKLVSVEGIEKSVARQFRVKVAREIELGNPHRCCYASISNTFVDDPYVRTGLSRVAGAFEDDHRYPLHSDYLSQLSDESIQTLLKKLDYFDVKKTLWLSKAEDRHSHGYHIKDEYKIVGIDSILCGNMSKVVSELLWKFIIDIDPEMLVYSYTSNLSYGYFKRNAPFVDMLIKAAWIPVKTDEFKQPKQVGRNDLPDDWPWPEEGYDNPALKAIGFGSAVARLEMQNETNSGTAVDSGKRKEDEALKTLGVPDAQEFERMKKVDEIVKQAGLTPEQLKEKLSPKPRAKPKKGIVNKEHRGQKMDEEVRNAPQKTQITVVRTIYADGAALRKAARHYLRENYTIEDNKEVREMFCQLCQSSTSFTGRDKKGYFDATQVFREMKCGLKEQFLSLCPSCRAMYNEWVRLSRGNAEKFRQIITNREISVEEEQAGYLIVELPDENETTTSGESVDSPLSGKTLHFTVSHFHDLKKAVEEDARRQNGG